MKHKRAGYTLIELMIVVILIGIITALAAPQISQGMANNAVSEATSETIVAFRAARAMAAQQSKAHRVFITKSAPQIVRVDRGASNLCTDLPAGCTSDPLTNYGGVDCGLRVVYLKESRFERRGVRIKGMEIAGANQTTVALCITPGGRMYNVSGAAPVRTTDPVEILIDRADGGVSMGVERRIIVNTMGMARTML